MAEWTYDEALKSVLSHEGGYTNDPHDPGGPTNFGITIFDARMYWKHDATARDVASMPLSVAKGIYKSKYWDKVRGDELPAGVDFAVFDFGVNSGVSRAVKYLQGIAGVPADGVIGPVTLGAIRDLPPGQIINKLFDRRLNFLQRLRTWRFFGRGWGRRVREGRELALSLATRAAARSDA